MSNRRTIWPIARRWHSCLLATAITLAIGAANGPVPADDNQSGGTQVFGITARGSSFVYVFDRSLSMKGAPLAAAKRELVASLGRLTSVQQFQIIFYNDKARTMQPAQMFFADQNGLRQAENYVAGIVASGGTDHVQALRAALRMGPDVVFFLTDADDPQLSPKELEEIRQKNGGVMIHVIEFKSGPDPGVGNALRKLAEQNRGEYKYVDLKELSAAP
jgi:hypothetical protein